jgi:hypothetical protein
MASRAVTGAPLLKKRAPLSFKKSRKKRAGPQPCSENRVDPISPNFWILSLIGGVTLLVRAGLLPRLGPPDFVLADRLSFES